MIDITSVIAAAAAAAATATISAATAAPASVATASTTPVRIRSAASVYFIIVYHIMPLESVLNGARLRRLTLGFRN